MSILTTPEIRAIEFTERRKGFDPDEVAAFMDDVCETIVAANEGTKAAQDEAASLRTRVADLEAEAARLSARAADLEAEHEANRSALSEAAAGLASAQESLLHMQAEVDQMRAVSGVSESVELLSSAQATAAETITRAQNYAEELRVAADGYAASAHADADLYSRNTRGEADNYSVNLREIAEQDLVQLRVQAEALRDGEAAYRSRVASVLRSALEFVEGAVAGSELPAVAEGNVDDMFIDDVIVDTPETSAEELLEESVVEQAEAELEQEAVENFEEQHWN